MFVWADWVVDNCLSESATSLSHTTPTRPNHIHFKITYTQRESIDIIVILLLSYQCNIKAWFAQIPLPDNGSVMSLP